MAYWRVLDKLTEPKNPETKGRQKEIIQILLKNRGLTSLEQTYEFLNPPDPRGLNPQSMGINKAEIAKAVRRIEKAIDSGEQIIIYGDYDVDGICGTAILWETLNNLGAKVLPYIPHRVEEGYGLSKKGIDNLLSDSAHLPSLIITVDQGVTATKEVDYAEKKGVDIIITDHHQKPKTPPRSLATVWTDKISGAGVAWVLAKELTNNHELLTNNYLDLVALATVADLLPLQGANRSLVKFGLLELNKTQRPGLLALFEAAGLILGKIGIHDVSFAISPRLNATGRIEHAMSGLRLLCIKNNVKARALAQKLNETNRLRQLLTEEALVHARQLLVRSQQTTNKLLFVSHSSYNEGVIGLVAGKLTEEFYRPTIVVAEGKTLSKASARSISGFNIIEAIRKSEKDLVNCGGHPMAAGFTAETLKIGRIRNYLLTLAEKEIAAETLEKTLKIDCELDFSDIDWYLYEQLKSFEPFGISNPEPVFLTRKVSVKDIRLLGAEGKHLKLLLDSASIKSRPFSTIGFGLGTQWGSKLTIGDHIDVVYTLLVDSWNGEERLQLKIKDLRPSAS